MKTHPTWKKIFPHYSECPHYKGMKRYCEQQHLQRYGEPMEISTITKEDIDDFEIDLCIIPIVLGPHPYCKRCPLKEK